MLFEQVERFKRMADSGKAEDLVGFALISLSTKFGYLIRLGKYEKDIQSTICRRFENHVKDLKS